MIIRTKVLDVRTEENYKKLMVKTGDKVRVKFGVGSIQDGTVVAVYPDGSFDWANCNNAVRRSREKDLRPDAKPVDKLNAYVKAWVEEEGE